MENLLYTSSSDSLLTFISQQKKNYKITIDFKDYLKYINPRGEIIDHYVLNTVYIKHTQISPIYKIIKRNSKFSVVKVTIPEFTIFFPQYHNIKYSFIETSLNLMIETSNFTVEYDDVVAFFDNGISNYLRRTIDSIFSTEFKSSNNLSLFCNNYDVYISTNYLSSYR